jgi:kynurenine formamidase
MPALPNEPPTYLQRTDDGDLQALHLTIRQGTYLRLPADTSFEHMSPRRLLVSAVVIDSRDRVRGNPNYRLAAADISAWEREHGRIPRDALVLLVTGWDMRWGNTADYLHLDDQQTPVVPGISAEAAELLYERGVRGIGIDTPIPVTFDGWRLANLTNLEQLPPTGATLSIGALKLQAAAISPVRVLALLP